MESPQTETVALKQRYEIVREIGRGGSGRTFLGIDRCVTPGRQCAIKKLQPLLAEPQQWQQIRERFHLEAAALAQLSRDCRQIPHFYDHFSEAGNFYLVQEWIEGSTLAHKVCQDGPLTPEAVTQLLCDLLPVLASIHRNRVIHRDIKPDNIILRTSDGLPVLIDFGAVKEVMGLVDNDSEATAKTVVVGTPSYMAPEQAVGRPVYASDLYGLALTAIHLLTGHSPQALPEDPHTGELLWRQSLPNLRGPLATALDKALCFHPRDRFASAEEMLSVLSRSSRRLVLPLPPVGPLLTETATAVLPRVGRRRSLLLAAAIAAVATVGTGLASFRLATGPWPHLPKTEMLSPGSVAPVASHDFHASLSQNDSAEIATEAVVPDRDSPVGTQPMQVAWYGPGYHGNRTASGETFSRWARTAAHPTWPFGTRVRVTNPQNGRSSVVRINDRSDSSLDVSEGVAAALGFKEQGIIDLDVDILQWGSRREVD